MTDDEQGFADGKGDEAKALDRRDALQGYWVQLMAEQELLAARQVMKSELGALGAREAEAWLRDQP